MSDPVVLIAAGAVGGALVTGALQSVTARADRRRDGRNAARILYLQLYEADSAVGELRDRLDWREMITDWEGYGVTWREYRDQVGHVLTTPQHAIVHSAFASIASLARARHDDLTRWDPPIFSPEDELLRLYEATIANAEGICLAASFRWHERKARRRVLAPLKD
jgi:hypothetical protein